WFARFLAAFTNPFMNSAKRVFQRGHQPQQYGSWPMDELLEDRLAPATVARNIPGSGNWDMAGNWTDGSRAPQVGDDMVINTTCPANKRLRPARPFRSGASALIITSQ